MKLELKNNSTEGIVFDSPIVVWDNLITNSTKVSNFVLQGDFSAKTDNTIYGDLNITGDLSLNATHMIVDGDLTHSSGTLNINGGSLAINGNFLIDQSGGLIMRDANDLIVVSGDFETSTSADEWGYLSAGVLEVKGDFSQKGTDNTSFYTTESHKVLLNGTSQQTVSFERTDGYGHFINLTLTNNSIVGVVFSTTTSVMGDFTALLCQQPLDLSNVTIHGNTYLLSGCNATTDTDGDGIPDDQDPNPNDGPLADNDNDGIINYYDPDDDNDGMPDIYETQNALDSLDASDANMDADGDGYTNIQEYQAGTNPTDAYDNPLPSDIVGKTKYFITTTGAIGMRTFNDDGATYTGSVTLEQHTTFTVSGSYGIEANKLTLERVDPNSLLLVFTYMGEEDGVMHFDVLIDAETQAESYFYDTEEERDRALNKMNPAVIMYLLD